ncbi:IS204/IS1001/IS1096/IS1165 transposase [Bdellovibrio bacteriovorus W]|nr:IS204/IS1001/IS1096/IS1165 transposase [Bdellovibrio bacteriovorus W]
MFTEPTLLIPRFLDSFQGFSVKDIKEFIADQRIEIHLEHRASEKRICSKCLEPLGNYHDRYHRKVKHLKIFNFQVEVHFFTEQRHCAHCKKVRAEWIPWLCPTSPHITMDLAWYINRLSEIATVRQVGILKSVDKMTCYKIDKYILGRLLQGYKIPKVTHIGVDEVYARGPKQQKSNETRDDLFFTVIVDLRTHKVIWISKSRRKEALDTFFSMIGPEACEQIQVVATDQHEGYGASVKEHCKKASLVWDRFHLVQRFTELINDERKNEAERVKGREHYGSLLMGKNKWIFLKRATHRTEKEIQHINEVLSINSRLAKIEIIKERFYQMFDSQTEDEARLKMYEIYEWSMNINAWELAKYISSLAEARDFWNYFTYRYTTSVVEGINRGIKTLKWVAYGYKDMAYFSLKIMQKFGYLNHKYALNWLYSENT